MKNAGVESVNQLDKRIRPAIPKNRLYDLCHGRKLARRDEIELLCQALSIPLSHLLSVWEDAQMAQERATLLEASARSAFKASWDSLPLPTGNVFDIIQAQHEVSDTFPYNLLGVTPPPASKIYIRSSLQAKTKQTSNDRAQSEARSVPLEVALNRHEHVLVVGEPGYGKSMLGRSIVRQLSGRWLRTGDLPPTTEAVVPLYLQANQLPPAGSWSGRIAAVIRQNEYLISEPESGLFADRIHGVRWLIVIDGLDEIHDQDRRLELLHVLRKRIRQRGPYRLVITTRPLPQNELELLRNPDLGEYSLQPFGPDELTAFAKSWFEAQEVPRPESEAARFIEEVTESHLRDLVQIPLLATIAAAMQSMFPGRTLPATQVELYERFIDELLHARPATAVPHDNFTTWYSWMHSSRKGLLSFLARLHLDSETQLISAAKGWADQQRPINVLPPRDDRRYVEQALTDSGLAVIENGKLRFIHQSIAEYLAADYYAARADATIEGLDQWVSKAIGKGTSANLARFTLAIWSRGEANDGGQIIRRFLDAGSTALGSLISLIVAGVRLDTEMEAAVVGRVIALFHEHTYGYAHEDLVTLVMRLGNRSTLSTRLDELIASGNIRFENRVKAASAYAMTVDKDRGIELLRTLDRVADPTGRLDVFYALHALKIESAELSEIASSVMHDPSATRWTRMGAAHALLLCGELSGVRETAFGIARDTDTPDQEFARAAELLVELDGRLHAREILELVTTHRRVSIGYLEELATAFGNANAYEELKELAQFIFAHPDVETYSDLPDAVVTAWSLLASENGRGAEIEEVISAAVQISAFTRVLLADEMHRAGLHYEAASLIKRLLGTVTEEGREFAVSRSLAILVDIDVASHWPFVVDTASDYMIVGMHRLIDYLATERGKSEIVIDAARRLLTDPVVAHQHRVAAVDAWLRVDISASETILPILRDLQPSPDEFLDFAKKMDAHGAVLEAHSLAISTIADTVASRHEIVKAVKIVYRTGRENDVRSAIEVLRANRRCTPRERAWIATELTTLDAEILVQELWIDVLAAQGVPIEDRIRAAEELRRTGAAERGLSAIDSASRRDLPKAEAGLLAGLRQ